MAAIDEYGANPSIMRCPECGQGSRVTTENGAARDESCPDCGLILRAWFMGRERPPVNQCSQGHGEYEGVECPACVDEGAV